MHLTGNPTMPERLTCNTSPEFPLRALTVAMALGLTGLMAGCSSTPNQSGASAQKVLRAPTSAAQAREMRRAAASGKTYAAGGSQAGGLDSDSLDSLETLLEATDMDAVENNRLVVMRYGDLWTRMRAGFKMDLDVQNSRINAQRNWFASRQPYIDRLTARASRYLYHTVTEAERRGIPTELALLPVIESSYDPAATSNAAAAGMWQFIPSTGKIYGLRQNDLYDGRRDVVESTRAAYDFLTSLYNKFGSWELALASYNAGPGRIQQAINYNAARGLPTDYWSLRLPTETMNYVPRFLAVAQIVRDPQDYNLNFPPIANRAHFREVSLPGAIDLSLAEQVTGLSTKELYELNPAFRRGQTDPEGPHRLLIPSSLSPRVDEQLARLPTINGVRVDGALTARQSTGNPLNGGAVLLSQSRSYSAQEAAALMGAASAPVRVQKTQTPSLSAQITTRPNVPLPTSSAALAALANQASLPSGAPKLAMPTVNPNISTGSRASEPPLSASERQRLMNNVLTQATSVSPTSTTAPRNAEPALSPSEKAQVVAEIKQVLPSGTKVLDPLDGKIELTAIQTQQSVLEAKGKDRQVSYELPYTTNTATSKVSSKPVSAEKAVVATVSKPPKPKGERMVYTVQAGDTLSAISSRYSVDINDVADWNQMARNANLMTGTQLYLYGAKQPAAAKPTSYVVQAGDTLTGVASRFGLSNQQLADYNSDLSPTSNLFAGARLSLVETASSKKSTSRTPAKPSTDDYKVKSGESLIALANRFNISVDDLANMNSMSSSQMLQLGQTIQIPAGAEASASSNSSSTTSSKASDKSSRKSAAPSTDDYKVKSGESLIALANRFNISVDDLASMNKISSSQMLQLGQIIQVPSGADSGSSSASDKSSRKSAAPSTEDYKVKSGESLIALANRFNISVDDLASMNKMSSSQMLQLGQTIQVPSGADSGSSSASGKGSDKPSRKSAAPSTEDYKVKSGESLIALANRFNVSVDDLASMNKMSSSQMLQLGQTIQVPTSASSNDSDTASSTTSSKKSSRVSDAATNSYTVQSGDTLIGIANRFEVDPAELARMNKMSARAMVQLGQRLTVPDNGPKLVDYVVRSGDTLARVASKHGLTLAQLAEINEIPPQTLLHTGDTLSVPAGQRR
jgi:LysM repeat protein/soluble lytic murein transglycosylase-like protein